MAVNIATPSALDRGAKIRRDLLEAERAALHCAVRRGFSGTDLIELADALGLCDPRPAGMLSGAGSAISPDFGSGRSIR